MSMDSFFFGTAGWDGEKVWKIGGLPRSSAGVWIDLYMFNSRSGASTAWTRASATPSMTSRSKNHGHRLPGQDSRPPGSTGCLILTLVCSKAPWFQHKWPPHLIMSRRSWVVLPFHQKTKVGPLSSSRERRSVLFLSAVSCTLFFPWFW